MYVTLASVIFAGVLTMAWCKLPILKCIAKPIDNGACLKDKNRIFGDNKTWKGFVGYVLLNTVCLVLWGLICSASPYLSAHNYLYFSNENTLPFNALAGALLGLGYALFELPNSFLKRRLGITPGKPPKRAWKVFFIVLDQADSLFGCVLTVCIFYPMGAALYFAYVAVGAATHIVINMLLYFAHLRKNMF